MSAVYTLPVDCTFRTARAPCRRHDRRGSDRTIRSRSVSSARSAHGDERALVDLVGKGGRHDVDGRRQDHAPAETMPSGVQFGYRVDDAAITDRQQHGVPAALP